MPPRSGTLRGDFSRFRRGAPAPATGVWMQQGRVQLDSDWNAQAELLDRRLRREAREVIGPAGGPAGDAGFEILPKSVLLFDGRIASATAELEAEPPFGAAWTLELRVSPRPGGEGGAVVSRLLPGLGSVRYRGWSEEVGQELLVAVAADGRVVVDHRGREIVGGSSLLFGRLNHVAVAFGETETVLYVNGEAVERGRAVESAAERSLLLVGASLLGDHPALFFDGIVYEVGLWRGALDAAAVGEALRGRAGGDGLAGRWRFHDRCGDLVPDSTGHHGPAHLGAGVPGSPDGESSRPRWVLHDLLVGRGRYWVDGIACDNPETVAFGAQADYPDPGLGKPSAAAGARYLFYLDVWERFVTDLEDPALAETALGGADTTGRSRVVAQVKRLGLPAAEAEGDEDGVEAVRGAFHEMVAARDRSGTLRARRVASPTSLGNLLYRVEVHWPGAARGSTDAPGVAVEAIEGPQLRLDAEGWERLGSTLAVGQSVEVARGGGGADGSRGTVARIASLDPDERTVTLNVTLDAGSGEAPAEGAVLRPVATFKWSRTNSSVAWALAEPVGETSRNEVVLRVPPREGLDLEPGDWVELSDERSVLLERVYALSQVRHVDAERSVVVLRQELPKGVGDDLALRPVLRRWDQRGREGDPLLGGTVVAEPGWQRLEAGIEVELAGGGPYRTGDYWWIVARHATQGIEWPEAQGEPVARPPDGVEHVFAPLALLAFGEEGFELEDLRSLFRPLVEGDEGEDVDLVERSIEVRDDVTAGGCVEAREVRAEDGLWGALRSPGSVGREALATGAVGRRALAPEVGTLPPGAIVLGESPTPPEGFADTEYTLTLVHPRPEWISRGEVPWEAEGAVPTASAGGRIYAFPQDGRVWELDPATGAYREVAALPDDVTGFAVAGLDGRVYLAGGESGGRPSAGFWELDPAAGGGWSERERLPGARRDLALAVSGGRIWAIGGRERWLWWERASARVDVWDPAGDSWRRVRGLPKPCYGLGAAGLDGWIYAVGGVERGFWGLGRARPTATTAAYHPPSDRWSSGPALPAPRSFPGVAVGAGRVFVAGGDGLVDRLADVEELDPAADRWAPVTPLPAPVVAPGLAAEGGLLFALGVRRDPQSPWLESFAARIAATFHLQRFEGDEGGDSGGAGGERRRERSPELDLERELARLAGR